MAEIGFETKVEDGKIVIPLKLRDKIQGEISVTVKVKENEEEPYDIISKLIKNPLEADDPTPLTREEIYDRSKKFLLTQTFGFMPLRNKMKS